MDNLPTSVYKILYDDEIKKIKVFINSIIGYSKQIIWNEDMVGWCDELIC